MSYNHFLPQGFIPGPIQVPIDSPKSAVCVKCPRNAHENAFTLYIDKQKSLIENRKLVFWLWSVILSRCSWLSVHAYDRIKKGEIISSWTENKYMYYVLLGNLLYVFPSHFISRSANTGENKHYYLSSNRYFRTISFIGHLYGQTYL